MTEQKTDSKQAKSQEQKVKQLRRAIPQIESLFQDCLETGPDGELLPRVRKLHKKVASLQEQVWNKDVSVHYPDDTPPPQAENKDEVFQEVMHDLCHTHLQRLRQATKEGKPIEAYLQSVDFESRLELFVREMWGFWPR